MGKLRLLGFLDELTQNEEVIVEEFNSKCRRNINASQKQIISKYYSNYFDEDFWKDRLIYAQQFRSKIDGNKYIIVKMPCDIALFEC